MIQHSTAISLDLQKVADVSWSTEWGMELKVNKTKLMMFGDSDKDEIKITINRKINEQIVSQKYLGVILDPELSFTLQVDNAFAKVKRATAKIASLYDGREGKFI